MFDTDGTGTISFPEFHQIIMHLLNIPEGKKDNGVNLRASFPKKRIEYFWKLVDDDDSGEIEYNREVLLIIGLRKLRQELILATKYVK